MPGKPRTGHSQKPSSTLLGQCSLAMSLRATQVNVGLVLDAGALMAVDQRSRTVGAALEVARRDEQFIRTSAGAMAEVWRDGSKQVNLVRLLSGIDVVALDNLAGRRIGELLGTSRTPDVVGAHVALLVEPGDTLLTSDPTDLTRLLHVRRIKASVVQV
jgi:hypothetical protein